MKFRLPRNSEKFLWTLHSIDKMRFYGLSDSRVKRVINNPKRKELGVAPNTVAVMQPNSPKHSYEIWAMYQNLKSGKKKIIAAWRYPGRSPIRGPIPVPTDILEELGELINNK
jgi:hypothetical protein